MMKTNAEYRAIGRELLNKKQAFFILMSLIVSVCTTISFFSIYFFIFIYPPLSISLSYMFLRAARKNSTETADLAVGFQIRCWRNILAYLILGCFILFGFCGFIFPAVIIALSGAMVPYILVDHPEMTAMDAIRESHRLMKGNKKKLFRLILSFSGWIALSVFSFGILLFWVIPYIKATITVFYEDVRFTAETATQEEDLVSKN